MTIPKQLLQAKICNKESCQEIEKLELENERLKLTITQLECKIDLLKNKENEEINVYKETIKIKDKYIKLIEENIERQYIELEKRIDSLCFTIYNKDLKENK